MADLSPDAPYWSALKKGRLVLPRCGDCGQWTWPAVDHCGLCGHDGMEWLERPMEATIFAWTRTWHRFGLTESLELPYVSIVAELSDCGIRLMGRLDDPDQIDPLIGENIRGAAAQTRVLDREIPTILWTRAP